MSVRYPKADCGCTVEVYDRFGSVCRMDCAEGGDLLSKLMTSLKLRDELPDSLVIEYNRHVAVAVESVMRERAA